jgi:SAM-dependent methyltransferase
MSADRGRLRATFDAVAELYERARPGYPEDLFDDLVALGGLRRGSRLLEIGCGTGQATLPLARRGLEITCVELGPSLAVLARAKLAPFPRVAVVRADFETWEPPAGGFDAVAAFTAFHWLDPAVRFAKPARLLRAGGALAVAANEHVLPDDGDPFFAEVQDDYDAIVPSEEGSAPPRPEEVVRRLGAELEASGRFRHVAARSYLHEVGYDADAYIAVLDTYSDHRALPERTRRELYARIRRRIEARPERTVRKTYLATLDVALRR